MAGDQEKIAPANLSLPESFDVVVVDMDKVLFEGKASSLILPTSFGNLAVLPGHTPLFTSLIAGKIVIHTGSDEQELEITEGVAKITQDKLVLLVGYDKKEEEKKKK
jgi:F0F1-type ATP synthase epsilon subunit